MAVVSAVADFQAWCKQDGRLKRWLIDERFGVPTSVGLIRIYLVL
jgi:hypothetical protein